MVGVRVKQTSAHTWVRRRKLAVAADRLLQVRLEDSRVGVVVRVQPLIVVHGREQSHQKAMEPAPASGFSCSKVINQSTPHVPTKEVQLE